jgi:3-oxoacyl-[acyl-carrier-protein] synthase III
VENSDQNAAKLSDYVSFTESSNLTSPEMACRAATIALRQSGLNSKDIAAMVYAQFDNSDHFAPVCHLQRALKIHDALAFELGAASDGGAMGLEVAASLLRSDTSAKAALVTAAARFQAPRWRNRWCFGIVLSDGSAAAVLSRERGLARLIASAHSSTPDFETLCAFHVTNGDPDVQNMLIMKTGLGPYLDDLKEGVANVIDQVLKEAGVKLSDITKFAVTGIGLAQLTEVVLEPLGITPAQTTWPFLRRIGHAGPCDQLLGLDYLLREGELRQGDMLLVLGMGLGFRYTCLLLEVDERKIEFAEI